MVLTIKNFGNPVWPWIVETAPTNLVWVAGTLKATLTWTSATGESWVTWTEEKLVRKEWSAPQWSMDWTTVATITTKDTYASTGYEDTGLDSTKTYYYKVFAVYDNWTERGSSDVNVTPQHPAPIIIETDFTTATEASVLTDWWTWIIYENGKFRLDSNWLRWATATNWTAQPYKDLSNLEYEIDNITWEATCSIAGSWRCNARMFKNTNYIAWQIDNSTSSLFINYNDTKYQRQYFGSVTWTYNLFCNYNVKTGVTSLRVEKNNATIYDKTQTLTQPQREGLDNPNIAQVCIWHGNSSWYNNTLKYAKLTINF